MRSRPWLLAILVVVVGSTAEAAPFFGSLGHSSAFRATWVVDVSSDGSFAAGNYVSSPSTGHRAGFRQPAAEPPFGAVETLPLPGPSGRRMAYGISPDGNFVVGTLGLPPTISDQRAARWDASTGLTPERFDDPDGLDVFLSIAEDATNDGTTVGWLRTGGASGPIDAYRWLPDGTPQMLPLLPNASYSFARAHGISGDGSRVAGVGRSEVTSQNVAVRWVDGVPENLGMLPSNLLSWGWDLSLDGTTVVGWSSSGITRSAMRWVEGVGMASLGTLPGSTGFGEALGVSADGGAVVGFDTTGGGKEAFLWDAVRGMRSVEGVLAGAGLAPDLTGWNLESATGISADGLTLVGTGISPNGTEKGWIAVVPEPGTGILLMTGLLVLARGKQRGIIEPFSVLCGGTRRIGA